MKHPFRHAVATAQESLYRALFDLLPTSVVLEDLDGRVRDVNPAFCRWMGFTRDELIGVHVSRFSNDTPEDIERNLARLRSGETARTRGRQPPQRRNAATLRNP